MSNLTTDAKIWSRDFCFVWCPKDPLTENLVWYPKILIPYTPKSLTEKAREEHEVMIIK